LALLAQRRAKDSSLGSRVAVGRQSLRSGNVGFGSIAAEMGCPRYVRFSTDSGRTTDITGCLKRAKRRHSYDPRSLPLAERPSEGAAVCHEIKESFRYAACSAKPSKACTSIVSARSAMITAAGSTSVRINGDHPQAGALRSYYLMESRTRRVRPRCRATRRAA